MKKNNITLWSEYQLPSFCFFWINEKTNKSQTLGPLTTFDSSWGAKNVFARLSRSRKTWSELRNHNSLGTLPSFEKSMSVSSAVVFIQHGQSWQSIKPNFSCLVAHPPKCCWTNNRSKGILILNLNWKGFLFNDEVERSSGSQSLNFES